MKLALATLIFFYCLPLLGQLKGAPDWVLDPPQDDLAFHGIGVVNPEEHSNHRASARNLALRELAEKIFVSIDAKSELQVNYEDDRISYVLDERIEVASSNYLMGYQLVDEWTNKKSTAYYVLFRLDRLTYLENRRRYFEQLDEIIDIMDASAQALFDQGELVRGINELSTALLRLEEEMHTIIEPEYSRHLEKKHLRLVYEMERVLSRLMFNVKPSYSVNMMNSEPFAIEDYLKDAVSGAPVRHMNARLEVIQGDVFRYRFDKNTAHEALLIEGFFPERGSAKVRIKVDPPIPGQVKQFLDAAILRRLSSPTIELKFQPYTVSIIDRSAEDSPYDDFIRTVTEDLGLQEVSSNPDLHIFVETTTQTNRQGRHDYEGRFQGKIWVSKDPVGIPDFQYKLPSRTHWASNRYKAKDQANQESFSGSQDFLVQFVSYLCSKNP